MFSRRRASLLATLMASTAGSVTSTTFVPGDPFWAQVALLLRTQSTDAMANQSFDDESISNHAVTANGNVTQGSFSPFQPNGWSVLFPGSTGVTAADHNDFTFSGDFTVECWFYNISDITTQQTLAAKWGNGQTEWSLFFISGQLHFYWAPFNTGAPLLQGGTLRTGAWHHAAVTKSGTAFSLYLDGTRVATATNGSALTNGTANVTVGHNPGPSTAMIDGYIYDMRILDGTAQYAGTAYTVPSGPLTAITNTVLLTCQDNRFIDNSSTNKTITVVGTPKVVPLSPFGSTAAYDPATHGGSGYFDGAGDYLSLPNHSDFDLADGSNVWTVEAWAYPFSSGGRTVMQRTGSQAGGTWSGTNGQYWVIYQNTVGEWRFEYNVNGSSVQLDSTTSDLHLHEWAHLIACCDGTNTSFFVNGVRVGTSTTLMHDVTTPNATRVGELAVGVYSFDGFIGQVRVVKGTDVYGAANTSIVVPASPLIEVTNTKLLLNFTNAGVYDAACRLNPFSLIAQTQTDTAQTKFADTSVVFDGTGDYANTLSVANSMYEFGTNIDFTIECWIRYANLTGWQVIAWNATSSLVNGRWLIWSDGSELRFTTYTGATPTTRISAVGVLSAATWHHVAVTRHGNDFRMFLDGTQVGSTWTASFEIGPVGDSSIELGSQGGVNDLEGWIEDFRITHGTARYIGNFTPPADLVPAFYGFSADAEEATDSHWKNVAMLLKGTGDKANNVFDDESTSNHTITANGDVTQGTFSPFSPGGWAVLLDGANDAVSFANHTDFDLPIGSWTVEFWIYLNSSQECHPFSLFTGGIYNASMQINTNGSYYIWFMWNGSAYQLNGTGTTGIIKTGRWHHIAITCDGTDGAVFVDGVRDVHDTSMTGTATAATSEFAIGYDTWNNSSYVDGIISNFRIVNGTAVYEPTQSTLSVPTSPLTAIANTKLLACASNRYLDKSSGVHSATVVDVPKVIPMSPFASATSWSAASHGGSGHFDGTGDYLTAPSHADFSFGTGDDWTLEMWVYPTDVSTDFELFNVRTNSSDYFGLDWDASPGELEIQLAGVVSIASGGTLRAYEWAHIAAVRNSGTIKIYVNGIEVGSASNSSALTAATANVGRNDTGATYFPGFISGFNWMKGSAKYISAFSVPTSPPSASANTKLILNFTNAGVYDAAAKAVLKQNNTPESDTAQIKFGPSSVLFETNESFEVGGNNEHLEIGDSDFCLEGWFRQTSQPGNSGHIIDYRPASTDGEYLMVRVGDTSTNTLAAYTKTSVTRRVLETPYTIQLNVWYHFAFNRIGQTMRLFVNGDLVDQANDSTTLLLPANRPRVGDSGWHTAGTYEFNGNIEDLRLTIGEGRYEEPFSIPTSGYPTSGA